MAFRPGFLHPLFALHLTELIFKFSQCPDEPHFSTVLDTFIPANRPIFLESASEGGNSVLQVLEDLIYRNQNTFMLYSFDWHLCHLSFVCSLVVFWLQIEMVDPEELVEETVDSPKLHPAAKETFIRNQKLRMKQNLSNIAC